MSTAPRAIFFFGLWLVLAGADPAGLPFGLLAAAAATWASLRLSPPAAHGLRPLAAVHVAWRTLVEAVAGGIDVARRVFDPRLPLQPGYVRHTPALAAGPARDGFLLLASLQPGSIPAGVDLDGALLVHALDTGAPVASQLAAAEALFATAVGAAPRHG